MRLLPVIAVHLRIFKIWHLSVDPLRLLLYHHRACSLSIVATLARWRLFPIQLLVHVVPRRHDIRIRQPITITITILIHNALFRLLKLKVAIYSRASTIRLVRDGLVFNGHVEEQIFTAALFRLALSWGLKAGEGLEAATAWYEYLMVGDR